MKPTITAFESSPDRGRGLARDMRVRWAFEEVGQPYDVRLVSFQEVKQSAHRRLHPFGQIPTYEAGNLTLFESGAIIFHIAERHAGLPSTLHRRSRPVFPSTKSGSTSGWSSWGRSSMPIENSKRSAVANEASCRGRFMQS